MSRKRPRWRTADLGVLDAKIADAIIRACDRLIAGEMLDQFMTDMIQGGAGTSTNMNANEVIANRALELLGHSAASTSRQSRTTTSTLASPRTTSIRRR